MGLFTFPTAINCLRVPAQLRGASNTSSTPVREALLFLFPAAGKEMGEGSAGVPSIAPQRRANPAILCILIISQQCILGHPFLSQPWPSRRSQPWAFMPLHKATRELPSWV